MWYILYGFIKIYKFLKFIKFSRFRKIFIKRIEKEPKTFSNRTNSISVSLKSPRIDVVTFESSFYGNIELP